MLLAGEADWPQFRGTQANGTADGKITLPFNRPVGGGANALYLSDTPTGPPPRRGQQRPTPDGAGPPDASLDT